MNHHPKVFVKQMTPLTLFLTRLGVFFLVMTPLFFWRSLLYPHISTKLFWVLGVSELTLLCLVWFLYQHPSWKPKISWPVIIFLVYVGIMTLTSIFGVYPMNSFWGDFERNVSLNVWLHLSVVLIIVLSVFRSKRSWIQLSFISTIIGLVVSFIYIFSFLHFFSNDISNGGSTLGNSSLLGSYLIFAMFFALLLFFLSIQFRVRLFGIVSFAFFVLVLFLTDARAAMISFGGGAILFIAIILFLHAKQGWRKISGIVLFSILIITFIVLALLIFKSGSFFHKMVEQDVGGSRFIVWDIAAQSIKDRPWFGWGLGNFKFAFLQHYNPCFGNTYCGGNTLFDSAHNKILDVWVEVGLFGLIAYLLIFLAAFFSIAKAYLKKNIDAKITALFVAVLAAYFAQNLTVFDSISSLVFFVFLYGFGISVMSTTFVNDVAVEHEASSVVSILPILYTLAFPFLIFYFVIQPLRGGLAVKTASTTLEMQKRFSAYELALNVSPFGRDLRRDFLGLGTGNILWSYDPVKDVETIKKSKSYFQKENNLVKNSLQDTLKKSPDDVRAYIYLLKIFHAEGRLFDVTKFADAENVLQDAIIHNPKQKLFYWISTAINLEQNKIKSATESMKTAIELSPDSMRSEWNTFLFAKYVGDKELLDQSFSKLILDYPKAKEQVETILKWDVKEMKYKLLSDFYLE